MKYFEKFVYSMLLAMAVVMWAYMIFAFVIGLLIPS